MIKKISQIPMLNIESHGQKMTRKFYEKNM